MQIASRPFYSKTPIADDDEPIYLQPTKPHLIIRLMVFLIAIGAGWMIAWGSHDAVVWTRNQPFTSDLVKSCGFAVHQTVEYIRTALYR